MRRAAIVGVGLIGGSLGMAWRRAGTFETVAGVGRSADALATARGLGAVDEATTDLAAGVAGAELVVLAAPVRACIALLPRVAAACAPGAVITDVASTKAAICATAADLPLVFVGGHPMAGSERGGVASARSDLFVGARWVIAAGAPAWAEARVRRAVEAVGARPLVMDAAQHDERVAASSHLPQAVAVALAASVPMEALAVAGRGFHDTTRLAASPASVWNDVFATNRDHVVAAIARFEAELSSLRGAIAAGDEAAVAAAFARAARRKG